MSKWSRPEPALLFTGILFREEARKEKAKKLLVEIWGELIEVFPRMPFTFTDYYFREMGKPLFREYWTFAEPVPQEGLVVYKKKALEVEEALRIGGKRDVNIDPGIITLAKVILLSTKDYAHRIYLGEGVYAELTLTFSNNTFHPLPWTYPDYRQKAVLDWFTQCRNHLKRKRSKACH